MLIMIVLFEISLRLFYPQKIYDDCYEYSYKNLSNLEVELDSHLGWKLISNYSGCRYQPDTNKIITKTHNSNGLRIDKDIPYEKGSKKRVLLLGDSFVYGYGLDDDETIAVKLQENLGDNYEIINFGVDGYGTGQELLQFMEDGLKYHPDIVLLFFYPNDFTESQMNNFYFGDNPRMLLKGNIIASSPEEKEILIRDSLKNGTAKFLRDVISPTIYNINNLSDESIFLYNYPTEMIWNDGYGPNKKPLFLNKQISSLFLKYSHLYSLIYHKLSNINPNVKKIKYADRITDGIDIFYGKKLGSINPNPVMFLILNLINEFEKKSATENYKFIVVGIPEKRNVNEKYQEKFLNQYSDVDESMFEFQKIDRIFGEELPKKDIDYISLYDLAEENFDKFYFKTDGHWNPNGVKLSADYITKELKKRKII